MYPHRIFVRPSHRGAQPRPPAMNPILVPHCREAAIKNKNFGLWAAEAAHLSILKIAPKGKSLVYFNRKNKF
jgi:hypothetical protein